MLSITHIILTFIIQHPNKLFLCTYYHRACQVRIRPGFYWCFLCLLALLLFLGEYFDGGRDLETCRFYGLSWIALGISGKPKINIIRIRKLFLFLFLQTISQWAKLVTYIIAELWKNAYFCLLCIWCILDSLTFFVSCLILEEEKSKDTFFLFIVAAEILNQAFCFCKSLFLWNCVF